MRIGAAIGAIFLLYRGFVALLIHEARAAASRGDYDSALELAYEADRIAWPGARRVSLLGDLATDLGQVVRAPANKPDHQDPPLSRRSIERWVQRMRSDRTRQIAGRVVSSLGSGAVSALLASAQSKPFGNEEWEIILPIIASVGERGQSFSGLLVAALCDPVFPHTTEAIDAIARLGSPTSDFIFASALHETLPAATRDAVLAQVSGLSSVETRALELLATSRDWKTRLWFASFAAHLDDNNRTSVHALLTSLMADKQPEVGAAAARTLLTIDPAPREALSRWIAVCRADSSLKNLAALVSVLDEREPVTSDIITILLRSAQAQSGEAASLAAQALRSLIEKPHNTVQILSSLASTTAKSTVDLLSGALLRMPEIPDPTRDWLFATRVQAPRSAAGAIASVVIERRFADLWSQIVFNAPKEQASVQAFVDADIRAHHRCLSGVNRLLPLSDDDLAKVARQNARDWFVGDVDLRNAAQQIDNMRCDVYIDYGWEMESGKLAISPPSIELTSVKTSTFVGGNLSVMIEGRIVNDSPQPIVGGQMRFVVSRSSRNIDDCYDRIPLIPPHQMHEFVSMCESPALTLGLLNLGDGSVNAFSVTGVVVSVLREPGLDLWSRYPAALAKVAGVN